MALTVSLEQLRTDSLLYADQRPGGANEFVGTADLDRLINQQIRKWQDLLIAQRPQDQEIFTKNFTITPGTPQVAFVAGDLFYSLVSASILWNGSDIVNSTDVEPFTSVHPADIYKLAGKPWGPRLPKGYVVGFGTSDNIAIFPTPTTGPIVHVQYIKAHKDLVASPGSPNTIVTYNGWDMFIAMGVAIQLLAIAGRDSSHLRVLWDDERKRLEALASERIVCEAKEVREVYPEGGQGPWPWNLPPWP